MAFGDWPSTLNQVIVPLRIIAISCLFRHLCRWPYKVICILTCNTSFPIVESRRSRSWLQKTIKLFVMPLDPDLIVLRMLGNFTYPLDKFPLKELARWDKSTSRPFCWSPIHYFRICFVVVVPYAILEQTNQHILLNYFLFVQCYWNQSTAQVLDFGIIKFTMIHLK